MGFSCVNELEIRGGSAEERRSAAALATALDSVDDSSPSREEAPERLVLRFESVDGLPEEGVAAIAAQFPELSFTLVYYSREGGFYGCSRTGPEGSEAMSEDLEAEAGEGGQGAYGAPELFERYGGDGIAFARERLGLGM
jgi:hypothetical protein